MVTNVVDREKGTRERLLAAAGELVHAYSYRSVGVQAICEMAQVKKGSFYHFFASKQALMLAVLDENWEAFKTLALDPIFRTETQPRDRISGLFEFAYTSHTEIRRQTGHVRGCPFGSLAAEASTLDDPLRARLLVVFEDWTAYLRDALADAQVSGELREGIDVDATAWGLLSCLQGLLLVSKTANDTAIIPRVLEEIMTHLWNTD